MIIDATKIDYFAENAPRDKKLFKKQNVQPKDGSENNTRNLKRDLKKKKS